MISTETWRSIADLLLRQNEACLQLAGQEFRAWMDSGATRRGMLGLVPAATPGGDHGRGDAIEASRPILRYWREQRFGHLSDHAFARALKEAAGNYFESNFSNNDKRGIVPDDEFLRDVHRLIASGALTSGGRIISEQTIHRRIK